MDNSVDAASLSQLRAIAAALGVPVESFFADFETAEYVAGTNECVRLWGRIKTAEGRRRALAYLQNLAEEPI